MVEYKRSQWLFTSSAAEVLGGPPGTPVDRASANHQLLRLSSRIADRVAAKCCRSAKGRLFWDRGGAVEEPSFSRPDGYWDLYLGVPGPALFLAAHHRLCHVPFHRDLCLEAIEPIRRQAQRTLLGHSRCSPPGIGAIVGACAWIYTLLQIGKLLGEPGLVQEAHDLTLVLTPEGIANDDRFDFIYGCSGAILVLIALDRVHSGPNRAGETPLQIAAACAEHLLACRPYDRGQCRKASSPSKPPLRRGLSHGAAAISLALGCLGQRTDRSEFWEAASQCLAFERQLPSPGDPPSSDSAALGWCLGAPGIALARLSLLACGPGPQERALLEAEIQKNLDITRAAPLGGPDHVCCGTMGRVEVLIYAFQKTSKPCYLEAATAMGWNVAEAAMTLGRFSGDSDGPLDASFFRGISGVGYAFLRLFDPGLPCLLALE